MTVGSSVVQIPATGTYRIDPDASMVRYTGRHLFGLGVVHATFFVTSGSLRVAEPLTASTVQVSVDPASFHSGNPRRDRDVTGAGLLDATAFPDITFSAEGLHEDDGHWVASGTATAHGSAVPVDVVIHEVTHEPAGLRVRGRAEHLDRRAFGVTGHRGMVGRYLDLDLDVLAVPVPTAGTG